MLTTPLLTQAQLHTCVPLGASTPQLFTATDDPIQVYGIRRVYYKCQGQPVVIPYFACDVKYPIISVSRLIDRGYDLY